MIDANEWDKLWRTDRLQMKFYGLAEKHSAEYQLHKSRRHCVN